MKGRVCADGTKQRRYSIKKKKVDSPTVQIESYIASMIINALEGRDVATADVAGAHLKSEMNNLIILKVSGDTANIMCKANPSQLKGLHYN